MHLDPSTTLRSSGLRVTRQRVAVIAALTDAPHSRADTVLARVRNDVGQISTQAVYDVLNTLTERGLIRRIQVAGSPSLHELRVGDNHHHLVCRSCGTVSDVDCAAGAAPCLEPEGFADEISGFVVDEAEVTYWGLCQVCAERAVPPSPTDHPSPV
jgi:Fe2+ or Zn2+ uptake regulation protein